MKKTDKQKLFEAFEKVCKIKLLKEEKSPRESLKDILIDNIDLDPYDNLSYINQFAKGDQKILEMFKIFKDEREYDIKIVGLSKSIESWLRGLPTVVSGLPTYYDELTNLLYAIGYIDTRDTDEEIVDKTYYTELTKIILDTVKKNNYL
jgi:hypothetical protein